jgi:phosphopantothenoylcysteine decarboxylase/phosphopantothenate--cysteine ligase
VGKDDFSGKRVVVTAGGTQEPIDPVRHIGNRSSGKMGYALAEAARDRGATVILVTAPATAPIPTGMEIVRVRTVAEMREALIKTTVGADALIMAAAVSDFRVANPSQHKIKKQGGKLVLELVENKDFLLELPDDYVKVGFAAESEHMLDNARKKLAEKRLDLIAANDITAADSGFDVDTNRVTLIDKAGKIEVLPLLSKHEVAERILDRVSGMMK